ncbi:type 1 fimbrial protein [Chromobacterium haemolyticum]|uniref:Type 1 fimbrial protein n=1 Tax=Chromobacterium haemolyticum TaxID=394935 RepID=A0ABS3GSS2_9NEIS|nr:fimbrial protein [Chromobacterium haemolyticum]MBK0416097.1 type 1 fimbrial protein [Chromobacterium haemolyticum]MBO0417293.1 type 1 fimbrial protein [Chromobacterium haemolyticum]MBO0500572.1 type 1 fimbrial protein [Chromobacterium haemolyticum]
MKQKHALLTLAAVFAAALPLTSQAAVTQKGTIKFTGSVTAPTCKIDSGTGATRSGTDIAPILTVNMPAISMDKLVDLGQVPLVKKAFQIKIECSSASNVKAKFTALPGSKFDGKTTALANAIGGGKAKGVGVAIYKGNTPQDLSTGVFRTGAALNGSETIDLDAVYVTTNTLRSSLTAGEVQADLPFELSYD